MKELNARDRIRLFELEQKIKAKIIKSLRARMKGYLKEKYIEADIEGKLGCSFIELALYLESKFEPEMEWGLYGFDGDKGGWVLDHIVPLKMANLDDPGELAAVCHYTNLQPLWRKDNSDKSDNCSPEALERFRAFAATLAPKIEKQRGNPAPDTKNNQKLPE